MAPTWHTIRLLAFFRSNAKDSDQSDEQSSGTVFESHDEVSRMSSYFTNAIVSRLSIVKEITRQYKDLQQTTSLCAFIPESLSMYHTERLVKELTDQNIDMHNIIITNQLLTPADPHSKSAGDPNTCRKPKPQTSCCMCTTRRKIQSKYSEQILELYEHMHVVQSPQLEGELHGVESVRTFASYLLVPLRR
ncbi:hypothetical protein CRM22_009596 [Opisthorchis felineus]|uniref:ArsA/GET3 Anion-transporting ATPase-like domain-containing protein n=1 Tax=Opisthorchis felineus TaxID=147828 RepID=A0A4S2L657_OPIFE|nr:hypothetical protein CRM22_009596 [Opisthorchis felineus]